ncbi:uncharacterized protein MELLADRAFT_90419 [Melampsora larici-populina 98AG31]|uniref:Uncharacterized protein n=1 Tax=Melampsora larici-populina (strain 98AG31 / pathotype 3-4-7) TaxID=747676 RepID=F4RWU9_MELLP|nr:uncharacterized protein MELLADRAFT_90419 [Melampsora larici-populina 98AG31]EGG03087.1 hypothetical protein MELLADRAFT_90419 [Melampsora larici-populina 98AG31]
MPASLERHFGWAKSRFYRRLIRFRWPTARRVVDQLYLKDEREPVKNPGSTQIPAEFEPGSGRES